MKICITASSRGISNIVLVIRELANQVKARGGEPFVIPAMGSHGGATDEGQKGILTGYGITEETVGCPIVSHMETVKIGYAPEIEADVNISKDAFESDGIIVLGRIKAHTGFKGRFESGLMKMMTVGLGKQYGAYIAHSAGDDAMPERLLAVGSEIIRKAPVIMGVGLMENAFDKTYKIAFVEPQNIAEEEPVLLDEAKAEMAQIFLDGCDVIILKKIGKNYSGGGMDPNVVGRSRLPIGIKSERMGIFELSEESHGNATGMGRADVTTQKLLSQISFDDTYANAITDHDSSVYKLPLAVGDEQECIKTSMAICLHMDAENPKIIMLENSLEVEYMLISEALVEEAKTREQLTIVSEPFELEFDENGTLLSKIYE